MLYVSLLSLLLLLRQLLCCMHGMHTEKEKKGEEWDARGSRTRTSVRRWPKYRGRKMVKPILARNHNTKRSMQSAREDSVHADNDDGLTYCRNIPYPLSPSTKPKMKYVAMCCGDYSRSYIMHNVIVCTRFDVCMCWTWMLHCCILIVTNSRLFHTDKQC